MLTAETARVLEDIFRRGNTAELKREKGKLVVVEIKRQVKIKTPANG